MKKKVIFTICILLLLIICSNFITYLIPITLNGKIFKYRISSNAVTLLKYNAKESKVVIPDKLLGKPVKVIGKYCFFSNKDMKEVIISNSVEIINDSAFGDCDNLESVEFGENVKTVGICAFSDCKNLNNVLINNDLKSIENQAFWGCKNLKTINIPVDIQKIGNSSFGASGLKSVTIPSNMEYIGEGAFEYTPWLDSQEGFVICGNQVLLAYNGNDENIIVPQGVKFLSGSFSQIENLENVYIPETVTYIGDYTFLGSDTGKVYIPASVTKIGTQYGVFSRNCEMTIVTTKGSYAEKYAMEEGMKCEIVDEIPYPYE